jgi:integrase
MQPDTSQPDDRRLAKTATPGIYKRGGRYVVRFRDAHGKQHKRFARTLAEARELKATETADVKRGEYRALSRVTFAEYAASWLKTYSGRTRHGIRASTMVEYRRAIGFDEAGEPTGGGAAAYFGKRRLVEIDPRDVKEYLAGVAASGAASNTVRNALAPLRAMFATAVEEGAVRVNPSAGVRLPRVVEPEAEAEEQAKALTEEELRALVAAVREERRPLVRLLAATGLRIGEALALTFGDVDFGRGRVKVRRRVYGGVFAPPKSRYGRRDVPLSEAMGRELWALRKARRAKDDELLFTGRYGGLLDASTVYRDVKAAGKAAGVPWAGPHTLRHTCATLLFKHGLNAKQVQLWLGHHSPAFTLATYVHLLADDLPKPDFLDDALGEISEAVEVPGGGAATEEEAAAP